MAKTVGMYFDSDRVKRDAFYGDTHVNWTQ